MSQDMSPDVEARSLGEGTVGLEGAVVIAMVTEGLMAETRTLCLQRRLLRQTMLEKTRLRTSNELESLAGFNALSRMPRENNPSGLFTLVTSSTAHPVQQACRLSFDFISI